MNIRFLYASIFFMLLSVTSFAKDGTIYSYGPDGKNIFSQAEDKILIQFLEGTSFEQKAEILSKENSINPLSKDDVLPAPDVTIANVAGLSAKELDELLARLNSNPQVRYANPFLIYEDGTYQGIQDRIIVRLKSTKDLGAMQRAAKDLNLNVLERNEFDPMVYVLQTTKQSSGNAVEIANKLHESSAFAYAEPDFLLLLKRLNTNDTNLDYQWSLENTGSSIQYNGTAGADMNVFDAWNLTTGSSSIKVAVLDEGVDLNHPDLLPNLVGGYDATGQGSAGDVSGDDAHGTACAGIIAAVGNNNLGVAGVAYDVKIIPVRIAYSNAQGNWVTSNTWIGNALNWSWDNAGADILSNSWGGGSSSSTINNAINGAVNNGRGGLGAPVLFAAGNDNGANSYPATQTNVISVIAMSMCYERKNPSSCDGETWWGSNYGSGADIAAPGVKIATTDISGSAGYGTGDYTGTFNGTSSATPNAAGVMALVLSANTGLTEAQARVALESTCRKVGSYTYNSNVSGQPNGTWSNDLGYGLVDAYQAVLSVSPQVADDAGISSISAPTGTVCATSATPSVTLNNFGNNALSSVTINYQLDGGTVNTSNWSGSLASASSTTVTLPSISFSGGAHTFDVWTSNPNGNSDNGPSNNDASSSFVSASNGVTLTIVLDNYPEETSWQVVDGSTVLAAGGTYGSQPDGSTVVENICLPDGCFDFVILDQYGDGICCGYGNGSYILTADSDGSTLASGGQFAASETTNFCITSSDPLVASISSSSNVTCFGGNNGSATASASGGVTPYSYSWSNGATGATASGITAGTYTVTVTDGNNDQAQVQITISQPTLLSASASGNDVNCFGQNDGSASVSVSGGTAPYSYSWNNGSTSATIIDLTAGNYSVTVTDANGCIANDALVVNQPSLLSSSVSALDASCNGESNGSVDLTVSGGTAPYTYNWSNGVTTQNLSDVSAGNYSVTIYDANGCSDLALASVAEPPAISVSTSSIDASCGSATDGSVDLSVSGGTPPYSYAWSNGETVQDLIAVTEGSYTVAITDANGCVANAEATVGESSTLASSASSTDVLCNGGSDGSASVSVSGGTPPYSYSWSNGGTGNSVSGLSAGAYSVTVSDAAGCSSSANVTVGEPVALHLSISGGGYLCNGATNGTASVSVSGGTAPYTYSWSNGANSSSVSGLSGGSYTVTIIDANGCSANAQVNFTELSPITVTTTPVSNVSCFGANDGSVSCSVNGGLGGYTYLWSNGGTTQTISGLSAGTYSVTVTDAAGCSESSASFETVGEPTALYASAIGTDISCVGATDGSATVAASGGTPPYIYSWSNGGTTQTISGLTAGITYTVTVSDANGCTTNASAFVGAPSRVRVTLATINATCETADGTVSSTVSGSNPPFTYDWSNGASTPSISGVSAGTYTLTVTNANGCSATESVLVAEDCGGCVYTAISSDDFESNWGIWNDGGGDCAGNSSATYSSSGNNNIQLRDNSGSQSSTYTDVLNLLGYTELTINFSYYPRSMDNANEDFWLQISTDGGSSFTTIEEWNQGDEFNNNQLYNESVVYTGPLNATTVLRFMCDASGNSDWIHLDDIVISGCLGDIPDPTCTDGIQNGDEEGIDCGGTSCAPCITCTDGIQNGDEEGIDCGGSFCAPCSGDGCTYETIIASDFESGWGIWNDGGSDARRSSNDQAFANNGTFCFRIQDNTSTSVVTTDGLNLTNYDELTVDFSYISNSMENGEDFWLQLSTDAGASFTTVESWARGTDFENDVRNNGSVVISGPFPSDTRLRFRNDASTNNDRVYIDDVIIYGCLKDGAARLINPELTEETENIDAEENLELGDVSIYPNPTSSELNVAFDLTVEAKIEIRVMDMTGKQVSTRTFSSNRGQNKVQLATDELTVGMYFITVIAQDQLITKRFIVQR